MKKTGTQFGLPLLILSLLQSFAHAQPEPWPFDPLNPQSVLYNPNDGSSWYPSGPVSNLTNTKGPQEEANFGNYSAFPWSSPYLWGWIRAAYNDSFCQWSLRWVKDLQRPPIQVSMVDYSNNYYVHENPYNNQLPHRTGTLYCFVIKQVHVRAVYTDGTLFEEDFVYITCPISSTPYISPFP